MNNDTTLPTTWSAEDSKAATQQGWDLFDLNPTGTRRQIQKCDETDAFADDLEAIAFVQAQAAAGDAMAQKALLLDEGIAPRDQAEIAARVA